MSTKQLTHMENSHDIIEVIAHPIPLTHLQKKAEERFGDMVKAVVDVEKYIMAIGGELHADEEAVLLESGSEQKNLWGINLYPAHANTDEFIEFDSMINIRPKQSNRSRGVENPSVREDIQMIVTSLTTRPT